MIRTALVLAPHPDDEVLGVGGTIARLASEGTDVHVAIVTKGRPPLFKREFIEQGRRECQAAAKHLGVAQVHFLDLPAAELGSVPHTDLNAAIAGVAAAVRPEWVFIPFAHDVHMDHQLVAHSAMVALRPSSAHAPKRILAYETLSETNWNAPFLTETFRPNLFVDVSKYVTRKLEAMRLYASQVRPFPDERSLEAIEALAKLRGASVGVHAAEGFLSLREVLPATGKATPGTKSALGKARKR